MERRKYYEAYDERYRQIHELDLKWFMEGQSEIVLETIESFGIDKESRILELGCGEGRTPTFCCSGAIKCWRRMCLRKR